MSAVVWKFPLRRWSAFIDMPEGARIVSVGEQEGEICVWPNGIVWHLFEGGRVRADRAGDVQ